MNIGAHVSAAGGLTKSIPRAKNLGISTMQIFASSPQSFAPPNHSPESISDFVKQTQVESIGPIFIHAIYLINLASPNPDQVQKSISYLTAAMNFAGQIGATGVIYHTGSTLGDTFTNVRKQVVEGMAKIVANSPDKTKLIVENSAGQGRTIGGQFSEVGAMIKDLASNRVGACLDTQHAFATGYDLTSPEGVKTMLTDWDKEVGLEKIICLHANDSKFPCGSGRDRHENIGQGLIGDQGFILLGQEKSLASLPWILEVPGQDKSGPDKENVDHLRSLFN